MGIEVNTDILFTLKKKKPWLLDMRVHRIHYIFQSMQQWVAFLASPQGAYDMHWKVLNVVLVQPWDDD